MSSKIVLSILSVAGASEWSWPEDSTWNTNADGATVCATGTAQSPIDIPADCVDTMNIRTGNDVILPTNWGIMSEVVHSHGVKVQTPSNGPFTTRMRGEMYTLLQCHFHYGSEHTFGGVQDDLCMHCVHSKDSATVDGVASRYGVLAFTWKITSSGTLDPFLQQFVEGLESPTDVLTLSNIDMSLVLDQQYMAQYVQYDGSLTTPPCSEAVDWHVLGNSRHITQEVYDAFMTGTGTFTADGDTIGNARTPQDLNGREPTGCTWPAPAGGDHSSEWSWPETETWGAVDDSVCDSGDAQSPIDIPVACTNNINDRTGDDIISAIWGTMSEVVYSHGIKAQTPVAGPFTTRMRGEEYTLLQCHFHYGSEHTFGGSQKNLCMHCVHQSGVDSTRFGVLGFTWEISEETSDPFLDQFSAEGTIFVEDSFTERNIDMTLVLNNQNMARYIQYDGSLTTPPCTEAVDWHVFTDTRPISQAMYDIFVAGTGTFTADGTTIGNARSAQDLNGREPTGCTWPVSSNHSSDEHDSGTSDGMRMMPCLLLPLAIFGSIV